MGKTHPYVKIQSLINYREHKRHAAVHQSPNGILAY